MSKDPPMPPITSTKPKVPAAHIPPAQKRRTKRQAPAGPSYPGVRASTATASDDTSTPPRKRPPSTRKQSSASGVQLVGAGEPRKEAAKRALAALRRS